MVWVPSPLTAAFSQSCISPEVSTLEAPDDSVLVEEPEEPPVASVEVEQAAMPRARVPTAAAATIRPMGRIGVPFVGWRDGPAYLGSEPTSVHWL